VRLLTAPKQGPRVQMRRSRSFSRAGPGDQSNLGWRWNTGDLQGLFSLSHRFRGRSPMHDLQRLKTGIGALDDILYGGLLAERLYLVDGNPGSGKTTLALQFLLEGARQGEKCLYVTLSETRLELEEGARSHGWSLEGIDVIELISDQQHELNGDGAVTMIQPSDVELSETTGKILDAIKGSNPGRVVFDSLS